MSFYGPNGDLNAPAGLAGPGTSAYTSDSYGYGYAREGEDGSLYVHTVYTEAGVYTNYHAYSSSGETYGYARETVYRSYPSPSDAAASGYAPGPYSATYGFETSIYQSLDITQTLSGYDVDQTKTSSSYAQFSSGYSTAYNVFGSSTFSDGSFVEGSGVHDAVETVTNPYGYTTSTPDYRTY